MVALVLVILVISQLICFYFIILLNTKVSKFKDLEKRQDQLIREMDDALALYLVEMKEENERFINELTKVKQTELNNNEINASTLDMMQRVDEKESSLKNTVENTNLHSAVEQKAFVPKMKAKNAYKKQKAMTVNQKEPQKEVETQIQKDISSLPSFEQKVLKLHDEGKTIDEIAKITQKGKTEIELLIKFHA